jgi:xanthine phosphoribosyltransferase
MLVSHGCSEPNIRVAVLINNSRSKARVEYAGSHIDRGEDKRWYVFPWEAVAPQQSLVQDAQEMPERLA